MRCRDRSRSVCASAAAGNALGMVENSGVAQRILVCPRSPLRCLCRKKTCMEKRDGGGGYQGLTACRMDGGVNSKGGS